MNPLVLVLAAAGTVASSAVVALALTRRPNAATWTAAAGAVAGGALGLVAAWLELLGGGSSELFAPWAVPGGALAVGLDPLSAAFLVPLFVLGPLCALYGRRYLPGRALAAVELNLLLATMVLVLVARHALVFLVAWEAMALLSYLLVTHEHGEAEVRRAGWVYLIASHVAVLLLIALFIGLGQRAGGALDFASFARAWRIPTAASAGLLVLALVGFGIKAGVIGLHVWLPEAHAAAPSHVSALMSGVLIKLGIYGILRMTLLLSPGPWAGLTLVVAGVAGAVLAMILALAQRDLKRVLAYSSIENVGVVLVALGLGMLARSHGETALATMALGAGILHVWNHAAMKGLLFLGAGNVLHATGTKDIERLGGLLRRMPWTGRAMLTGAVAIAALPPLNGFASEWLLYRALSRVVLHDAPAPALGAMACCGALAVVGGLAAICFVRLVGVVLLGSPRGDGAERAHEVHWAMTAPTVLLAGVCVAAALGAPALVSLQSSLLRQLAGASSAEVAAVAGASSPVAVASAALFGAVVLAAALLAWRLGRTEVSETWGCGYPAPSARMQYTGAAFSQLLAGSVLPRRLRAGLRARAPQGPFPSEGSVTSDPSDPLMSAVYEPLLVRFGDRFARLRFLQQGNVHIYILYIVATTIGALAWMVWRDWGVP